MTTPSKTASTRRRVGITCAVIAVVGVMGWFALRRNETEAERRARQLLNELRRQHAVGFNLSDVGDWLGSLPDPAGPVFRSFLGSRDHPLEVPEALQELGVGAWRPLTNALARDPDENVRSTVVDVLAELDDDRVTDVLREALRHESSRDLRGNLMSTLHHLGVQEAEGWILDDLESRPLKDAPRYLLSFAAGHPSDRAMAIVLRALEADDTAQSVATSLDTRLVRTNARLQSLLLERARTTGDDSLRMQCLEKLAGSASPDILAEAERTARDAKRVMARRAAFTIIAAAPRLEALKSLQALARSETSATRKDALEHLAEFDHAEVYPTLLERLRTDESTDVRAAAANGLAAAARSSQAAASATALIEALSKESSETVKVAILEALGVFHEPAAIEALRSVAANRGNSAARVAAIGALMRQSGPSPLDSLLELAAEPGFGDRPKAKLLEFLAARRDPQDRSRFADAIAGRNHEELVCAGLRGLAALGLSDTERPRVLELARTAEETSVRTEAIQALAGLRSPEIEAALVEILRREREDEPRAAAVRALGFIGGPEAIKALKASLGSKPRDDVRDAAVEALGRIGTAEAIDILIDHFESAPAVRPKLLAALGRFNHAKVRILATNAITSGNPELMQTALRILPDIDESASLVLLPRLLRTARSPGTRTAAATALARVAGAEVDRALMSALADNVASVRAAVVTSLGERHCHPAAATILPLLQAPEAEVQFAAAFALVALGATNAVPDLEKLAGQAADRERLAAASARAFLGDDSGVAYLARTLQKPGDGDWQTFTAMLSLMKLGTPEARRVLQEAYPRTEFQSMRAAGLTKGPTAALLAMLDRPPDVKSDWHFGDHHYLALRAFTYVPDPAALPAIERFVDDADIDRRLAARTARRQVTALR